MHAELKQNDKTENINIKKHVQDHLCMLSFCSKTVCFKQSLLKVCVCVKMYKKTTSILQNVFFHCENVESGFECGLVISFSMEGHVKHKNTMWL